MHSTMCRPGLSLCNGTVQCHTLSLCTVIVCSNSALIPLQSHCGLLICTVTLWCTVILHFQDGAE